MSKKCKCNCVDECCEGKKNFFWLIPVVLLAVTGFGLFGPKKIRKSGFGRVLKIILAFLWGGVMIFSVFSVKKALKEYAEH